MMKCGGCTLCCKLCNIPWMDSPNNEYCKECEPEVGCKIYSSRPDKCKGFQCAWSQMDYAHLDLRPDKSGVMFEKINDTLMLGVLEGEIEGISDLIKRQADFFNREGISVMMQQFNPYKLHCFKVKGHKREDIMIALRNKANGST